MKERFDNPDLWEDDEQGAPALDIKALFANLLAHWKFICAVTAVFTILGVLVALRTPRLYRVTMILAPEYQARTNSTLSARSSMMGLSSMSMNNTPDALNVTLFPEICSSDPFLCSLLPVRVTPYLDIESSMAGAVPDTVTVFAHVLGQDKELSGRQLRKQAKLDAEYFYDDSVIDPSQLTPRQYAAVKTLRQAISSEVDKKTGVTTIKVVLDDRMIVKQLADTVCRKLQDFVIGYRTKKAASDYEYYTQLADEAYARLVKAQAAYASSVDYDRSVILQSVNSEKQRLQTDVNLANQIYSQMAQQRELAKAKIQEAKPVYAVVQPSTLPMRSCNSRKKVVALWLINGGILSCGCVLVLEAFSKKNEN